MSRDWKKVPHPRGIVIRVSGPMGAGTTFTLEKILDMLTAAGQRVAFVSTIDSARGRETVRTCNDFTLIDDGMFDAKKRGRLPSYRLDGPHA